jgi:predicted nucleotidyltransferase
MNKIRDDMPENVKQFFTKLSHYLDTPLYFYGSVTRSDYVHGQSDIDVGIFTDNEYSTMSKLQHFLKVKKNDFEKLVWKLNGNMLYGFKIKCDNHNMNCEIAIYNERYKDILLPEFRKNTIVPWYALFLLYILKTFYYSIPLIPKKTYSKLKRLIFNELIEKKESAFLVLK